MNSTFALAENSAARYITGSVMYFAQGVPVGLMMIALPAWLVSEGVSAGEIGSFFAVITLPWALKLFAGPFMDRYRFLPMGSRRPWVLGAQFGLTVALLGLTLVENPVEQMGLLMMLGVVINIFAATQDVAVDGMAIDLTPVDEQGRLNAFMAFGKAVGWSISGAVSGVLLVSLGLGTTAVFASLVSGGILLGAFLVLERRGERVLPWSSGEYHGEPVTGSTFTSQFRGINAVLWSRASLVLLLIMFLDGLAGGYGQALMPIAAVKLFGFTTPEWSQLVAMMGLGGAGVALFAGPLIDRIGAKRMLLLVSVLVVLHAFLLARTQFLWEDTFYVRAMLSLWILMGPVTMVCALALAMSLCSSATSATQFAIYMSTANLGAAVGSKTYGVISDGTSYPDAYIILGCLSLALLPVLWFHRHRAEGSDGPRVHSAPQSALSVGVGRAGVFWSGFMRCPKCRADMELLELQGVQVDRCSSCQGLWFDAGELEQLRDRRIGAELDVGHAKTGKAHDTVHSYHCPRCGGHMQRKVDPQQRHIGYEQCEACEGSYFDAGEFSDLTTLSLGDFFKRLKAPARS
jgi:PAT family beta-lactamase induction signal transducer AmpG